MSRVDFYVLSEEGRDERLHVACQVIEKAFDQGVAVYAQTSTLADAQQLDEMLWTSNDGFVPHEVSNGSAASHPSVRILIGESPAPVSHRQLLVNLTNLLPTDLDSYERIVEIVDVDPEHKRLSRERYKAYRDRGCQLETHNL